MNNYHSAIFTAVYSEMRGSVCVAINQTPYRTIYSVLTEHLPIFSDKPSALRSVSAPSAAAGSVLAEAESSVNTAGQHFIKSCSANQTVRRSFPGGKNHINTIGEIK